MGSGPATATQPIRSWIDNPRDWDELIRIIRKAGLCGLDSEYTGVDFKNGDSCVNKAKIHVWSVAVLTNQLHPRGYRVARGAVLPAIALQYRPWIELLTDPSVLKPAHNSNVDVHAFNNAGVDVLGIINTLGLYRWMFPGRRTFNLDDIGTDYLGVGKTESFDDLFRHPRMITVQKEVVVKRCVCGVEGCRLRKDRPDQPHSKYTTTIVEEVDKQDGWYYEDQSKVVPPGWEVVDGILVRNLEARGHALWERYEAYARRDAVLAASAYDYALRQNTQTEIPWYVQKQEYSSCPEHGNKLVRGRCPACDCPFTEE